MCRRVSVNGMSRYHPNNFGCNAESAFASSTKVRRQSLNHLVGARRYSSAAVNASNRVSAPFHRREPLVASCHVTTQGTRTTNAAYIFDVLAGSAMRVTMSLSSVGRTGRGAVAKRCPECNYVAPRDPIMCPACGIIYAEFETATDTETASPVAPIAPQYGRRRRWLHALLPIFRRPHDHKIRPAHTRRRFLNAVAIFGDLTVKVGRAFHLRKSSTTRAPREITPRE